jgi:hypothetical protein
MDARAMRIQSAFDLAIARNTLRRKIAERDWKPLFRARAAAALTAMADLILVAQTEGVIKMDIVEKNGRNGIRLGCDFVWPDSRYIWLDEARSRLSRVTDEMEIQDTPNGPRITAQVWVASAEL